MTIDIGRELHAGTKPLPNFGLSVGSAGPDGMYLSKARSGSERSNKARINAAAVFLHRLLPEQSITALMAVNKPAVYVEYHKTSSGNIYQGFYDDDTKTIMWNNDIPGLFDKLLPFIIFALHPDSPYSETRQSFSQTISNYNRNGAVNDGDIYLLCDDFYFEYKNHYALQQIELENTLDLNMIRQGYRTGEIVPLLAFSGLTTPNAAAVQGVSTPSEIKHETVSSIDYNSCKAGAFIIDNIWDLEQDKYIPPLSKLDSFVPIPSYFTIVSLLKNEIEQIQQRQREGHTGASLIGDNYVNVILVGKPGTGKTTIAYALASTFGMPIRTISVSKNSEEDTYEGKTKTVNGAFNFVPTPFLEAYKSGGIMLLEEFNLSDPATIMGALGQAIESPFVLYEDGYKPVYRNPYSVLISTMNTATQGSREPSEAFTSRSPFVFMIDDPEDEDFIKILKSKGYDDRICRSVFDAYKRITEFLLSPSVNEEETAYSIGVRSCLGALKLISIGCPFHEAIKSTMIGTIAIKNLILARRVTEDVLEIMPQAA